MSKQLVLTEFLSDADTQIRIFDMGRRVSKIPLSDFQKFEKGEQAYWYPYQQTAWVALLFWHKKDKTQHNIWFLRMPLDESGLIQISARDEFMNMLMSRLGEQITQSKSGSDMTHALKDNPYVFKPTQENMAVFHSKALLTLQQTPSQFYQNTLDYLNGDDYSQWQNLGLQGIADVVVRVEEKQVQDLLIRALPKLPEQVFAAFASCLENENCDAELTQIIAQRALEDINNVNLLANSIRALANSKSASQKKDLLRAILASDVGNQAEILVAIAAKDWASLQDNDLRQRFLNKLADNPSGQELFNAVVSDLMFIPGMRPLILEEFRKTDRTDALSNAVGLFFKAISG